MKKFLCALAVIAAVALVGCKKDDEKGGKQLEGTSWVLSMEAPNEIIRETITFQSDNRLTDVSYYWSASYGESTDTYQGSYTYDAPKVTMRIDGDVIIGVISGNTMTVYDLEDYPTFSWGTFYKK